jgi:hypothetical protein
MDAIKNCVLILKTLTPASGDGQGIKRVSHEQEHQPNDIWETVRVVLVIKSLVIWVFQIIEAFHAKAQRHSTCPAGAKAW